MKGEGRREHDTMKAKPDQVSGAAAAVCDRRVPGGRLGGLLPSSADPGQDRVWLRMSASSGVPSHCGCSYFTEAEQPEAG